MHALSPIPNFLKMDHNQYANSETEQEGDLQLREACSFLDAFVLQRF
jgi:hypothetical protein